MHSIKRITLFATRRFRLRSTRVGRRLDLAKLSSTRKNTTNTSSHPHTQVAATVTGKKDFFGYDGQAELYRRFRPRYPESLLQVLDEKCANKDLALDIACGSGQLTIALAQTPINAQTDTRNKSNYGLGFNQVIGIDMSTQQLSKAIGERNIRYHAADAFNMGHELIPDNSCDLITIAQGLHWFISEATESQPIESLYSEIMRAMKPDTGIFAVLGYSAPNFLMYDKFQEHFREYYLNTLGSHNYNWTKRINDNKCYWQVDRTLLDSAFENYTFDPPFKSGSVERATFTEPKPMNEVQLFGYLESMSGYNTYCEEHGKWNENGEKNESFKDPLDSLKVVFREELERKKDDKMLVNFPFFLVTMKK